MASWCARAMRSMALLCANTFVMSAPKRKPAPRGERPQPVMSARRGQIQMTLFYLRVGKYLPSGSDQSRSHIGPSCGTSCFRSIARIYTPRESKEAPIERVRIYLVDSLQIWRQAAMYAEYSTIYDRAESEIVEHLAAPAPHVAATIFALALIIKAVHLCNLSRLVVASN